MAPLDSCSLPPLPPPFVIGTTRFQPWGDDPAAWRAEIEAKMARGRVRSGRAIKCGKPKTPEDMAVAYARWLAQRDGIDISGANNAVCEWEHYEVIKDDGIRSRCGIRAVEFRTVERRSSYSWDRGGEKVLCTVARIEIPNWCMADAHWVSHAESDDDINLWGDYCRLSPDQLADMRRRADAVRDHIRRYGGFPNHIAFTRLDDPAATADFTRPGDYLATMQAHAERLAGAVETFEREFVEHYVGLLNDILRAGTDDEAKTIAQRYWALRAQPAIYIVTVTVSPVGAAASAQVEAVTSLELTPDGARDPITFEYARIGETARHRGRDCRQAAEAEALALVAGAANGAEHIIIRDAALLVPIARARAGLGPMPALDAAETANADQPRGPGLMDIRSGRVWYRTDEVPLRLVPLVQQIERRLKTLGTSGEPTAAEKESLDMAGWQRSAWFKSSRRYEARYSRLPQPAAAVE